MRDELTAWYARSKRDLPWRRTRDPYAIWLSEAMLQQTRVETVIEYWKRFLSKLPTVKSLASATEEEVVALWSGLGYYRRARQLRAAACEIVERFGGDFPRSAAELRELPGIGRYTAGAVASIAFDLPEPLVDGNVARVFCRLFGLDGEPHSTALEKALWKQAAELVPQEGAGDWNQALMEFGATLCTASSPRCSDCPVSSECVALATNRVSELPRPKRKIETIDVELVLFLIEDRGRVLLRRRSSEESRMAGMWELPTREETGSGLFPDAIENANLLVESDLGTFGHSITRHRIQARVFQAEVGPGMRIRKPFAWYPRESTTDLALTGMTKKALARFASKRGTTPTR